MKLRLLLLLTMVLAYAGAAELNNPEKLRLGILPVPRLVEVADSAAPHMLSGAKIAVERHGVADCPVIAGLLGELGTVTGGADFDTVIGLIRADVAPAAAVAAGFSAREIAELNDKNTDQAYRIKMISGSPNRILLAGSGRSGLLYGLVTLTSLVRHTPDGFRIPELSILDWPDFKLRGGMSISVRDGKQQYGITREVIDIAFRYKINMIMIDLAGGYSRDDADRSDLPSPAKQQYLRQLGDYARDRGVKLGYLVTTGVGYEQRDGKDPRYSHAYRIGGGFMGGYFYCWSNDELFDKRAAELGEFLKNTGADFLVMHSVDGGTAPFYDSCAPCKARFGKDRAAADANVVNSFHSRLRKIAPQAELMFVFYPYYGELNEPRNGNIREYYEKLSGLTPSEVGFCSTDFRKQEAQSWNFMPQRIVRWQNMCGANSGLYYSPLATNAPNLYTAGRDRDFFFLNEVFRSTVKNDLLLIVGHSYAWNTTFPPAVELSGNGVWSYVAAGEIHREELRYNNRAQSDFMSSWPETESSDTPVLAAAANSFYGDVAGPFLTRFFRMGTFQGITNQGGFPLILDGARSDAALFRRLSGQEFALGQCARFAEAAQLLETAAAQENITPRARQDIAFFLANNRMQSLYFRIRAARAQMESLLKKRDAQGASAVLRQCLATVNETMDANGFSPANRNTIEKLIDSEFKSIRERIDVYSRMKQSAGAGKIGIYLPASGRSGGGRSLAKLLAGKYEILFLENLRPATLKECDLVIVSALTSFGAEDSLVRVKTELPDYVADGGKVLLLHNSVGVTRCQLSESLFPTICGGGERRSATRKLTVASDRTTFDHAYSDHWTLKRGSAPQETLLTDADGGIVGLSGAFGRGKVAAIGIVPLSAGEREELPEKSPEAEFLLQLVRRML